MVLEPGLGRKSELNEFNTSQTEIRVWPPVVLEWGPFTFQYLQILHKTDCMYVDQCVLKGENSLH